MDNKGWYVVWCSTGREIETVRALKRNESIEQVRFLTSTIEERRNGKWSLHERALIPGYIFVWCDMHAALYYHVKANPFVIRWLGPSGQPEPVPEDEMQMLMRVWSHMQAIGDPREYLRNVRISLRQRRGSGTLRILGKAYRITFGLMTGHKQPEQARG